MRKIIHTLLSATIMFAVSSCITDKKWPDSLDTPAQGENEVILRLKTPGYFTTPKTRALTELQENKIDNIYVLVFKDVGNNLVLVDIRKGENAGNTSAPFDEGYSGAGTFSVSLSQAGDGNRYKLVVLANAGEILDRRGFIDLDNPETPTPRIGMNYEMVMTFADEEFKKPLYTDGEDAKTIPMWGETEVAAISSSVAIPAINMKRALARIDVGVGTARKNGSGDYPWEWDGKEGATFGVGDNIPFTLSSVHVFRANDGYTLIPDPDIAGDVPTAVGSKHGYDTDEKIALFRYATSNPLYTTQDIYVPEAIIKNTAHTGRMAIVVGGRYNGGSVTYYRLDFADENDNPIDVRRNHLYRFTITNVDGPGYPSPKEAYEALPTNISSEIEVREESDLGNIIFDDQYYIAYNIDEFTFDSNGGSQELKIETDYPTWKATVWDNEDGGVEDATHTDWLTIDNGGTAGYEVTGTGGDALNTIALNAAENIYLTDRTAYIHIIAGRIVLKVEVTQTSVPDRVLTVASVSTFTYTGGTRSVAVTSHDGSAGQTPVEWEVTGYSIDGGTTWTQDIPDYLTFGTLSGTGARKYLPITIERTSVSSHSNDNDFVGVAERGSDDAPWNLAGNPSNGDLSGAETWETANCYIVNNPGWYSLPLVYGNAVQGGNAVSTSYISSKSASTYVLKRFLRHDSKAINNSYIYANTGFTNGGPTDATLVWQDVPGMVNNIHLDDPSTPQNLHFYIDADAIAQGNVVVAVRDAAGIIMWSWHIWVTPSRIVNASGPTTDPITAYNGVSYDHMQYALGYVEGVTTFYAEREAIDVQITQTGIRYPASQTFTITQNGGQAANGDANTYYQWGRKDPMIPSNGINNTQSRVVEWGTGYGAVGGDVARISQSQPAANIQRGNIPASIRNPYLLYPGNFGQNLHDWNNGETGGTGEATKKNLNNLWSIENTAAGGGAKYDAVVKTVYDPSPVGFRIPHSGAYTGFTQTGIITSRATETNVSGAFDKGWNFYIGGWQSGSTTFFAASGLRFGHQATDKLPGGLSAVGTSGVYWTAMPASTTYGHHLTLNINTVSPIEDNYRNSAYSVRPIADE